MLLRSFLKYWVPVLLWIGIIFVGSTDLLSAEHTSRIIGPIMRWFNPAISAQTIAQVQFFVRKAGHVSEYAILAALIWRAMRGVNPSRKMAGAFFIAFVASALLAALDEFHQSFVPSRTAAPGDVLIDACGALIGLTIYIAVARRKVLKGNHA